jgi:uncharacterized protein
MPSSGTDPASPDAVGITVSGAGRATGVPDLFVARFAAQASRTRPSEAMDAASAALSRMRDVAVQRGALADGLSTPTVSLRQDYNDQGRPHGFVADIALTVRTTQVASAGTLLTDCLEAGGEQARLDGTSFEHADPTALLVAAREAAFGDATARARQLAKLAGRRLGEVVSIDEGAGGFVPLAMGDARMAMPVMAKAVALEPGSVDASVTLLVRWAWA